MTEKFIIVVLALAVVGMWCNARHAQRELRRSLERLERWRASWDETRRFLNEFPDVATALEHLRSTAEGHVGTPPVCRTREVMRNRRAVRDGALQYRDVPAYTPEERQAAADFGIHIDEPRA